MVTDPVDRAEEFIQLFNRVESFLSLLVGPKNYPPFVQMLDAASVTFFCHQCGDSWGIVERSA
jgi:hypothetical protein